jgi:hypothetical protein
VPRADAFMSPQAAVGSRVPSWARTSCLSAVAADLLLVAAARQIPHPDCRPAEFGHHFRQASIGARSAIALWHFKQVQQGLRGDTFGTIENVDLAAHSLQRELPRINNLCRRSFALSSCILCLNVNGRIIPPIAPISGAG